MRALALLALVSVVAVAQEPLPLPPTVEVLLGQQRTDISVTWTNPVDNVTRFKMWWSDAAGNSLGTAYDTNTRTDPGQSYTVTIDFPAEPYLYGKYYIGGQKGPKSQVAGWNDNNRDIVLSWEVVPPGTGTANLSWVAPTLNADDTPLTDLAGFNVYFSNSPRGAITCWPRGSPVRRPSRTN